MEQERARCRAYLRDIRDLYERDIISLAQDVRQSTRRMEEALNRRDVSSVRHELRDLDDELEEIFNRYIE